VDHREREGFRVNSDYDLNNGSVRLVWKATSRDRFILTLDMYENWSPPFLSGVAVPKARDWSLGDSNP
jgi:hypothetical protein